MSEKQEAILRYFAEDLAKAMREKDAKTKTEWKIWWWIFWKLRLYPQPQPQHVFSLEAQQMVALAKHGFTIRDLAFIFDRSTSTVHETLLKNNVECEAIL